ncbi:MAG: hypothetical protein CBB67_016750 [Alteromonadaceae bacterium TMED7]|nr:hypothetical protein [Alteromonas sp.]RPH15836.1 MAG: hypothetical protein CBB67_016750 [Alteromonadaceae bacterium TMED7]|tara:strand:- start:8823 stop:9215 length:393 start_codon:yes stop_codon:yes gene_type:complete
MVVIDRKTNHITKLWPRNKTIGSTGEKVAVLEVRIDAYTISALEKILAHAKQRHELAKNTIGNNYLDSKKMSAEEQKLSAKILPKLQVWPGDKNVAELKYFEEKVEIEDKPESSTAAEEGDFDIVRSLFG